MARNNTLEYIYRAVDRMTPTLKKINTQQNILNSSIKRSKGLMRSMGAGIGRSLAFAGSKLKSFYAVAGGALAAGKFLQVGMKFQDAMLDLKAISGATGKTFEFLENKALKLARSSNRFQSEVAEGIKLVASAKAELLKDPKALIEMTDSMLLLSNAGGISLAEAVDVGAKSLNGFGKEAKFAAKFVDILAAGSKFGSSEIRQTGEAIKIAAGVAGAAGLSFLELNALIQTAAKGTFFGSQSGTAIQSIIGNLQTKGGINFEKLGLTGGFEKLASAYNSIKDPIKRAVAIKELFGEEHSKVAIPLITNINLMKEFVKVLDTAGIAQEQADIKLSSFSSKLRGILIIITEKVIKAFNRLEPKINKIAVSVGEFFDKLSDKQIDGFIDSTIKLGESLAVIVESLEKILTFDLGAFGVTDNDKEYFGKIKSFFGFGSDSTPAPINGKDQRSTVDINIKSQAGTVQSIESLNAGNMRLGTETG